MKDGAREGRESVRDRMIAGADPQEACSVDTSQNFCKKGETQQRELSHIPPQRLLASRMHTARPTLSFLLFL